MLLLAGLWQHWRSVVDLTRTADTNTANDVVGASLKRVPEWKDNVHDGRQLALVVEMNMENRDQGGEGRGCSRGTRRQR